MCLYEPMDDMLSHGQGARADIDSAQQLGNRVATRKFKRHFYAGALAAPPPQPSLPAATPCPRRVQRTPRAAAAPLERPAARRSTAQRGLDMPLRMG
jgi:hypothetical protein